MPRVLIVDDEPPIVLAVKDELVFEGLEVESALDGTSGMAAALALRPDVLLLDLMLPGLNGLEVCRRVRPLLPETWIILITARGQEVDRVSGFAAGADDYVVKPFSLRELVARIRVGLRRRPRGSDPAVEEIGILRIDLRGREVTKGGVAIELTRREFDMLALLARRVGEVIPRDEFCDLIWGPETYVTQRVIDTHIASLRRKLGDNPAQIVGVRGIGYKLQKS